MQKTEKTGKFVEFETTLARESIFFSVTAVCKKGTKPVKPTKHLNIRLSNLIRKSVAEFYGLAVGEMYLEL